MARICKCCSGRGYFRGWCPHPWEIPEPCIVCNGKGKLPNYTLKTKQKIAMPILKKAVKPAAPTPKSSPKTLEEGVRVSFLEEGTEMEGTISEVRKKVYIIEDDNGDLYEQPHGDVKVVEAAEEKPVKKSKLVSKGKGKGSSLVGLLKSAEAAPDGGIAFPTGNWEALLTGASTEEDKEGQRIGILEYTGVGDEEVNGKTTRSRSIIMTADGEEGPGMTYFKRDLLKLGVDLDSIESDEELDEALETLAQQQPWVDIAVKPQKNNAQYVNVYLQDVKENQDEKPELEAY